MKSFRFWAFWRRVQYGSVYLSILSLMIIGVYYQYFYTPANCFDNIKNGSESGVDCGGSCTLICSSMVAQPVVVWAKSFKITDGQFNAVAYVENKNQGIGTPAISYVFRLFDKMGLITERSGSTVLPPDSTYPIFEGRIDTDKREPTETTLELIPAKLWLPSTFVRSQFKTSSLQLLGVDARPRLNVTMNNTALSEAKDVEVVATIFSAQGVPLTASQTFIKKIPGRSQSDIVFTWPRPIAKTIRSCDVPTDIVVAIDLSGSMNNDGGNPPEPISAVLKSASAFVDNLRLNDQVAVVTFATKSDLVLPLAKSFNSASDLIKKLTIDPKEERGSTNTGSALVSAKTELGSDRHSDAARRVVVLLTDGLANEPEPEPEQFALSQAKSLKADDVTIYTIGLGGDVNMNFLKQLASSPNMSFNAPTTATLGNIYHTITADICEEGPSRIDIIPKTKDGFATYP